MLRFCLDSAHRGAAEKASARVATRWPLVELAARRRGPVQPNRRWDAACVPVLVWLRSGTPGVRVHSSTGNGSTRQSRAMASRAARPDPVRGLVRPARGDPRRLGQELQSVASPVGSSPDGKRVRRYARPARVTALLGGHGRRPGSCTWTPTCRTWHKAGSARWRTRPRPAAPRRCRADAESVPLRGRGSRARLRVAHVADAGRSAVSLYVPALIGRRRRWQGGVGSAPVARVIDQLSSVTVLLPGSPTHRRGSYILRSYPRR